MNIVIEGPDSAGKSTLGNYLSRVIGWPIISSEGPEKFPGEINDRIDRYLRFDSVIFDRHPCVSQVIYGAYSQSRPIKPDYLHIFYNSSPLFIYCGSSDLSRHQAKPHDSEEHLQIIHDNAEIIQKQYHLWATRHAHIWYRLGDSMKRVIKMTEALT